MSDEETGEGSSDDSGQRQDEWNSDEDEEEEEEEEEEVSGRVAELKMNDRGAVSPGRIHRGGG